MFSSVQLKMHRKLNYLIKTGVFSPVSNYLRPSNNSRQWIFNINAVVTDYAALMNVIL